MWGLARMGPPAHHSLVETTTRQRRGPILAATLVVLGALGALGCGDGGTGGRTDAGHDDGGADAGDPHLVLGTGRMAYEPLADGQEVPLYMGPQGGWHVYGGVQAYDVPFDGATLRYWLTDPATDATVSLPRTILLGVDQVLVVGDHWERFGDTVIINGQGPDFVGRTFELHVEVAPADGPSLTDERTINLVEGPVL